MNKWCKKLAQITIIQEWKKNRNLYAILLLNMLINKRLEEPFTKIPKEEELPIISQTLVNSKLTPKFWKYSKKFLNNGSTNFTSIYQEIKKEKNNINNKNIININSYNNYEKNNLIDKFESTPKLKNIDINGIIKNNNNKINGKLIDYDNVDLDEINLIDLKQAIEILQNDIIKKEMIITQKKEERDKLIQKKEKLEEILSSDISK